MMTKIFVLIGALVAVCSVCFAGAGAGVIPAAIPAIPAAPAALTVGTYATSYNAHAINHAIAAPYVAAPPLAYSAYSAYPALPAAAYSAYSAPIIAGRR
ncbi:PREDICTED: cuticle protein 16.5-like [Trachymyrmex cornetzi]|uniref:cuticle protein 16.5-like n=1 Tax=Trachymyrmex cornetzi TaxID=471704 RepID=UPI00084F5D98|nr:PREDICTED: cuticle protein 16.5-like [Trachymyrmex cornetzi]